MERLLLHRKCVYPSQRSTMTGAVRAHDGACQITSHHTDIQVAHLCPEHERDWFLRSSMATRNTNLTVDPDNRLNDLINVILLRSDLHVAFDDGEFVL